MRNAHVHPILRDLLNGLTEMSVRVDRAMLAARLTPDLSFTDAYGVECAQPVPCEECRATGIEYGETCLRCGGLGEHCPPALPECDTRIEPCARCGGDRGHHVPVGIDYRNGALIERWDECSACDGTGDEEVTLKPIEEKDLFPECDAGCGRECGLIEEVRRDWTWTCPDCEREAAMERLWEERNDR